MSWYQTKSLFCVFLWFLSKPPSPCTSFVVVIKSTLKLCITLQVCAEENCQEEVVLLALNYMDRFLSSKSVRKTHLQILAAACLLLASKLREPSCRALSVDLLVVYTDNSIYKDDLIVSTGYFMIFPYSITLYVFLLILI